MYSSRHAGFCPSSVIVVVVVGGGIINISTSGTGSGGSSSKRPERKIAKEKFLVHQLLKAPSIVREP